MKDNGRSGTTKKIGMLLLLVVALVSIPVLVQGNGGSEIATNIGNVGEIAFGTGEFTIGFPIGQDANTGGSTIGNDKATAVSFGEGLQLPFGKIIPNAKNIIEIAKNQEIQSENVSPIGFDNVSPVGVNSDQINAGNRNAAAIASGSASNNVKIVSDQII